MYQYAAKENIKQRAEYNKSNTRVSNQFQEQNKLKHSFPLGNVRVHFNSDRLNETCLEKHSLSYSRQPVMQLIKILSKDGYINFDFESHLMELVGLVKADTNYKTEFDKKKKSKSKPEPTPPSDDELINAIKMCKDDFDKSKKQFDTMEVVANVIAKKVLSKALATKNYMSEIDNNPYYIAGENKNYYFLGDVPDLIKNLESDEIFMRMLKRKLKIEEVIYKIEEKVREKICLKRMTELEMKDNRSHYFYSSLALLDAIKIYLLRNLSIFGVQVNSESNNSEREDNPYELVFGKNAYNPKRAQYEKELCDVYGNVSLHHIIPLSTRTKKYKTIFSQIRPLKKPAMTLEEYQWETENLVLGPARNDRVYEPGDEFDVEAEDVRKKSHVDREVRDKTSKESDTITAETPVAHMRTTLLQTFYINCKAAIYDILKARLLIPAVNVMIPRFKKIEIQYNPIVDKLETFKKDYNGKEEMEDSRKPILEEVIKQIETFGKELR